jgi:hypothetical protein
MTEASSDERVLGIVGGTGPESPVDYYRSLIATWRHGADPGRGGRRLAARGSMKHRHRHGDQVPI